MNVLEAVDGVSVIIMGELSAIGIFKQKKLNGVLQALFLGLGFNDEASQFDLPGAHST